MTEIIIDGGALEVSEKWHRMLEILTAYDYDNNDYECDTTPYDWIDYRPRLPGNQRDIYVTLTTRYIHNGYRIMRLDYVTDRISDGKICLFVEFDDPIVAMQVRLAL